jgi:hypothetical protein
MRDSSSEIRGRILESAPSTPQQQRPTRGPGAEMMFYFACGQRVVTARPWYE